MQQGSLAVIKYSYVKARKRLEDCVQEEKVGKR